MLVVSEVAKTYSSAAPVDCSVKAFTVWRFSSRSGLEVSADSDHDGSDGLQEHEGPYEPRRITWTGVYSKSGPVLVVHFVHPDVYNPTKRNSSSGPISVFSPGTHRARRMQVSPA